MIAKITRGDEMGGLVRYLLGPGRANEHTGMRVVPAGTGIDVAVGETLSDEQRRHLVDQLDGPYLVAGSPAVRDGHVWHLSLTNPSGDRNLSHQEWGDAVRTAMRALDFDDGQLGGRAPALGSDPPRSFRRRQRPRPRGRVPGARGRHPGVDLARPSESVGPLRGGSVVAELRPEGAEALDAQLVERLRA